MRKIRYLFVFLFVATLGMGSREAWAQIPSVVGIQGAVSRCEPPPGSTCKGADNAGANPHPSGVLGNALNFEDCSADLSYQFELGIANPSASYDLQAWAGTQDCSQLANRQTSATSVCWPVAPSQAALTSSYLYNLRLQDIASGVFTLAHSVTYTPSDASVCQDQTQTGASSITLYFFFVDGGSNPVGTVQQYPVTVDMRAGDVQGQVSVAVGDGVLLVSIPPTTDPDTTGYNVYCDPPPGQEVAADAGDAGAHTPASCAGADIVTGDDAGNSGGEDGGPSVVDAGGVAIIGGGAMDEAFQYGQPTGTKYLCGQAGATATSVNLTGLKDGYSYDIVVAATDAVGNVGPLSNVVCAEPLAGASTGVGTSTSAGTKGSSGGCSCSAGAGVPVGMSGLAGFMALALAATARKRKRS